MQVVWFKTARWFVYALEGGRNKHGVILARPFIGIRLGRLELRFGLDRFRQHWGRPINPWAYEHG
jgi:hypothetical protein